MRKFYFLILFLSFQYLTSQNINEIKISIQFENSNTIDVIKRIEKLTNTQFYFIEDWIDNKLISGKFDNVSLNIVLDNIFRNTVINYYISSDNKVILTRNSLIYDSLPKFFFGKSEPEIVEEDQAESFLYTQQESNISSETVRIGKENKNSRQKSYTLSGYVKDANTNIPIQDLALIVKNKNINAITDDKGFYSLKLPPGINIIETKALGILSSKKRVIMYNNGTLNFNLKEDAQILEEVIVEADKDKNVKEAVTGITQIKIEEIKKYTLNFR